MNWSRYFSSGRFIWHTRLAALMLLGGIALAASQLKHIAFDYELENYFPNDDPEFELFRSYSKHMKDEFNLVFIGLENEPHILDTSFIARVDRLSDDLRALGTEQVVNPFEQKRLLVTAIGPILLPYFHKDSERLSQDSATLMRSRLIGNLVSHDLTAINLMVRIPDSLAKPVEDTLANDIQRVLVEHGFDEAHLSGRVIGQAYFSVLMQEQFFIFTAIGGLLLVILLLIFYRSWSGLLVPMLIVVVSNITLIGGVILLDGSLNILSTIIPTIIFIVGVSDIIHLFATYQHEKEKTRDGAQVLVQTIRRVGLPTLLTSITTAGGFFTLVSGGITPVIKFGLITATGVLLAFVITYSIFIVLHANVPRTLIVKESFTRTWDNFLMAIFGLVRRRGRLIIVTGMALLAAGLWGSLSLKADNYLLEDLSEDDPHRHAFEFVEEKFSGVKAFELAIVPKDGITIDLFNRGQLEEIERIDRFLADSLGLVAEVTPATPIKMLHRARNNDKPEYFTLPSDDHTIALLQQTGTTIRKQFARLNMISEDGTWARMTGRTKDIGGYAMRQRYARFDAHIEAHPLNYFDIKFTGLAYLLDQTNAKMVRNLMIGLATAVGIVSLLMGLLFLSLRIAIVAMIVNLLPLFLIGGLMHASGITLSISTAIIFSIAFGIAVDDSIHFLSKYRIERLAGSSVHESLQATFLSTGRAIILTSLIILAGFISLIFGMFSSIFYLGLLTSLTLFLAAVADLVLLPALILLVDRE